VVVTGDPKSEGARALLAEIRSHLIPGRVLGYADGDEDSILYKRNVAIKKMKMAKDGSASAYICRNHTCTLPVKNPAQLKILIAERFAEF